MESSKPDIDLKPTKDMNMIVDQLDHSAINNHGSNLEAMNLNDTASVSTDDLNNEELIALDSWKNFLSEGRSAVVDTFYGQFKSSVS